MSKEIALWVAVIATVWVQSAAWNADHMNWWLFALTSMFLGVLCVVLRGTILDNYSHLIQEMIDETIENMFKNSRVRVVELPVEVRVEDAK